MFDIGGGELLLILIVALVAFGPKKLPELAQSIGRGFREFKRAQRDFTDQINNAIEVEQRKQNRTVSRKAPTAAPAPPPPVITEGTGTEGTIAPPMAPEMEQVQATPAVSSPDQAAGSEPKQTV